MQRLGRIMVTLGVLATLGLGVTAALGLRGIGDEQELRVHVLAGLVPLLVLVLSHLWILIYLLGATHVLRQRSEQAGLSSEPELRRFHRVTLPAIVAALVLAIGCFVLGTGVWAKWAAAWMHGTSFYLAIAAEAFAAWREWRTFSAAERSIRRLEEAA